MPRPKKFVIFKHTILGRIYDDREEAINAAKSLSKLDETRVFVAELKEFYDYIAPRSEPKIKRGYLK